MSNEEVDESSLDDLSLDNERNILVHLQMIRGVMNNQMTVASFDQLLYSSFFPINIILTSFSGYSQRWSQRPRASEILQASDGDRGSEWQRQNHFDRVSALRHHRRFPAQRQIVIRPRSQTHRWTTSLSRGKMIRLLRVDL